MQEIKRVAIIGVGLLGSSLGLAFKKFTEISEISGYDLDSEHLDLALEIGAIDKQISDLDSSDLLSKADLVILATPVGSISGLIEEVQPKLKPGSIITDVGSTKGEVINQIKSKLREDITYIPAHPMTGAEISGPQGADSYLFENAIYVLTPLDSTNEERVELLVKLLKQIGSIILIMSPKEHDQIVAAVSHLPHVAACTLVDSVGEAADEDNRVFALTAGGFRDATRIASGDPTMWTDICLSNSEPILKLIKIFQKKMTELEELLIEGDYEQLFDKFDRICKLRQEIPKKKRGLIPPTYEVFLTIPDCPNALGEVTSLLGEAKINIMDIEILRVRETGGTLRIVFATEEALNAAERLLMEAGYDPKIK